MNKFALIFLFAAVLIFAPTTTQAGILPACAATGACQFCDMVNIFVTLGKWLMMSAGGLVLVVVVWAGISLIISAGNAEKVGAAKKQIVGGLIGLGIILVAFQIVSFLLFALTVPSANMGPKGSAENEKIGSLKNFLGIPWWSICNVKELRTAKGIAKPPSTANCSYWGDGTPCQTLTADQEKKLKDCGELEGYSDLSPEEKEKSKWCKDLQISRCCGGTCSDKECITKVIAKPIADSSSAYDLAKNTQTPSGSTICRTDADKTQNTTCGRSTSADETRVRANLQDPNKDYAVAINNAPCPPQTCYQDFKADNSGKSCTTVGGLNGFVTASLLEANNWCKNRGSTRGKCIIITGGNECGHDSHGPSNVVDLHYYDSAVKSLEMQGITKSCPKAFQKGYTCEPVGNHDCAALKSGCPSGTQWLHVEFQF